MKLLKKYQSAGIIEPGVIDSSDDSGLLKAKKVTATGMQIGNIIGLAAGKIVSQNAYKDKMKEINSEALELNTSLNERNKLVEAYKLQAAALGLKVSGGELDGSFGTSRLMSQVNTVIDAGKETAPTDKLGMPNYSAKFNLMLKNFEKEMGYDTPVTMPWKSDILKKLQLDYNANKISNLKFNKSDLTPNTQLGITPTLETRSLSLSAKLGAKLIKRKIQ